MRCGTPRSFPEGSESGGPAQARKSTLLPSQHTPCQHTGLLAALRRAWRQCGALLPTDPEVREEISVKLVSRARCAGTSVPVLYLLAALRCWRMQIHT